MVHCTGSAPYSNMSEHPQIIIEIVVRLSWWDALKLRLAGMSCASDAIKALGETKKVVVDAE